MSATSGHTVELAEGNGTIRRLMCAILDEEGFDCVDGDGEASADLLIFDVDSDVDGGEDRWEAYERAGLPVLLCGLADSREAYDDGPWLDRPFNADDLIAGCRDALGLEAESSIDPTEPSTTREVDYDSPEMAAELGDVDVLDADTDEEDEEAPEEGEETEAAEVLEIDDASSMVVDVQDLHEHFNNSGDLGGEIEVRSHSVESLREEARELDPITGLLDDDDARTNPTVPDVPSGGDGNESSLGEESSGMSRLESNSSPSPGTADSTDAHRDPNTSSAPLDRNSVGAQSPPSAGMEPAGSPPASAPDASPLPDGGSSVASADAAVSPELRRNLAELASLIANSWNRIGLTARWEDRAERLERSFEALLDGGLSGASDELERVPPAHGFSGTIDVFPAFELIDIIRSRELLGRLEISNETGGYVLYFDGPRLVGVDDLEGRSEAMLLDCLRQAESVDDPTYEKLRRTLDESLASPLEMRLRTEQVVTDSQLLDARRTRAKWVVKEVLGARTGTFAFIHGNDESGQPWPVNELGLQVDMLAFELIREGAIDVPVVDYDRKTTFVTIRERLDGLADELLTPIEMDVLDYCVQPSSVGELLDVLQADEPELRAALERLEAVGFVVKLGEQFANVDQMFEFEETDANADSQMGSDE